MEPNPGSHSKKYNTVFLVSAAISIAFAVWGIIASTSFTEAASVMMAFLKSNFAWLYLWGMMFFVMFSLVLAFSKYGKIRLGADSERPTQSTIGWFAMLFAAGMGIGLVFWGVAEPLSHYVAPMAGIAPLTEEASRFSIRSSFMHWGLHPWGCYAIVGLALAYFQFRRKSPALTSSMLKPLIGKNTEGPLGKTIDIYTIVLTVIGVATSFGMGCLQISGGLHFLFDIPSTPTIWIIIIAFISAITIWSAISGVEKGMQFLSNTNFVLCIALLLIALIVGPSFDIIKMMFVGIGDYIINFIPDSFRMSSNGDSSWILNWRVFYWAWWLSWAPFVGIFIARISRGRTIREFVLGVMGAPTLVSFVWFSVFGGMGFNITDLFSPEELAAIIASPETAIYAVFLKYPLGFVLSIIAMILLFTFFVTSSNSATYVLSMLSSNGELNPPNGKKVFWALLMAIIAFALIVSGGVAGIQTIAVVIAFPFFFIMFLICASLVKAIFEDTRGAKLETEPESLNSNIDAQ